MQGKSFYDLDYIIEINEQRLEQYRSAYAELMGRLTTIVLVYSAMAIFLVPIVKEVLWGGGGRAFVVWFIIYSLLFTVSMINTIRFIVPVEMDHLKKPIIYYSTFRVEYEKKLDRSMSIDDLLKASYITQLEVILDINSKIYEAKKKFYRQALIFALWAIFPYIACFGFYISTQKNL